ncbi:TetR/AcrR family transcriptional regulator [Streptomyces sp. AK02-01A]|uniref:TetR/AcrR family transcriptional regulator n=1 Tax=Streptomyces sp. AK02-01A TaxID=3028648 RepID=UPI0029BE047B|nr:TetR family transcriptional regulator [Streptomyces sp. AK02-01A]MDX3850143.1 TetR family transcriptional regulator [Streptomyces sp. AK02-01A]
MTDDQEPAFQRARRPEQREARRRAILDAAETLLGEMPVAEVSLRELSRRVGLSKSNVVRYFETREAVFFELLNQLLHEWLEELEEELPPPAATTGRPVPPALLVDTWARSVAGRPLICELWSSLGTVLERNISAESVRAFKLANAEQQQRLARLVSERVPELDQDAARELVAISVLLIAGLWPFANPSPSVTEAVQDPRLARSRVDFAERLGRAMLLTITGLLADPGREKHGRGAGPY